MTTHKEGEIPTCTHFQRIRHDESKFWKLHPELRPNKSQKKKGENKANTTIQQDLGSDSSDARKITAMVSTGKSYDASSSSSTYASSSNINHLDEDKRVEFFHITVTSKHTKIDTLFDSGSQANLISEELVKKLGLETQNHPRPYQRKNSD